MSSNLVVVECANLADVEGILKLAEENDVEHGGTLTGHLNRRAVAARIRQIPSIIARKDGRVLGFLLTSEKTGSLMPMERKMLEVYAGGPDAYVYGPVCVDASMRGHGLAERMFAELRRLLPGREGILFIRAENEPSLRVHRKMGMREVADFNQEGLKFVVFAYRG